MNTRNFEPEPLKCGKAFHKKIQKDWINTAEGDVETEKDMIKSSGRKGRIDIFVNSDETLVSIVEIKASDWDSMTLKSVRRNVKRQAQQIWNYIESQLKIGKHGNNTGRENDHR